jgi:hypothetical protein
MGIPHRVDEIDEADFSEQRYRVFRLLTDGAWHSRDEIEFVAQAAEGMRRARELRKLPGWDLVKTPGPGKRTWLYKVVRIEQ